MLNNTTLSLEVGDFSAQLSNVDLPMGLRVSTLSLKGTQIAIQKDPFSIEAARPGSMTAVVLQSDLAAFLNRQAPAGLKDFKVVAKDGKLFLDAVKNMIIDVPAKAICTLRVVERRELWVDLESVDIMGAGAKNLVQAQLDKINPVLDVRELPIHATIETVDITNGAVVITGTLSPKG